MAYPNAFGVAQGRNLRREITWGLAGLILLGWASPLKGQEATARSGAGSSQKISNAFWPLAPNALPSPSESPSQRGRVHPSPSASPIEDSDAPGQTAPAVPAPSEGEPWAFPAVPSGSVAPTDGLFPRATEKPQTEHFPSKSVELLSGGGLPSPGNRIREGTRISEQKGTFILAGDRVVFSAQDKAIPRLVVLENLNLQRVVQMMQASLAEEVWVVTGRVTEFQGVNYLLLERAVRIHEADWEQPLAPLAKNAPTGPIPPSSEKAPSGSVSSPKVPGQ